MSGPGKPRRRAVVFGGQIEDRHADCAYNEICRAYTASKRHTLGIEDIIDDKLYFGESKQPTRRVEPEDARYGGQEGERKESQGRKEGELAVLAEGESAESEGGDDEGNTEAEGGGHGEEGQHGAVVCAPRLGYMWP